MKVIMSIDGRLTITPESDLEAYALFKWQDGYENGESVFVVKPDEQWDTEEKTSSTTD